ncbi:MAG: glutamate formiminotransferase [Chthonomonadaceae bacterium]|nr:glutamate formiminotransferase [Chthonomonadaceae bacterium]
MTVYQCVPNFSEGRRLEVVEEIANAIRAVPEVRLIDYSADPDHNRCVMTILGSGERAAEALLAAAEVAVARIDLRTHTGIHPRAGALDVAPFVPLKVVRGNVVVAEEARAEAVALSERAGKKLAEALDLPVYLYEWSARAGRLSALPELRRGGFEGLIGKILTAARAPDFGPDQAHPSAGIAVVGARGPLVAYNIDLDTDDVQVARHLARRIREERDRLPQLSGVRALGLFLPTRGVAQVSLNLTTPQKTLLPDVFEFVLAESHKLGEGLRSSEIIGAIPVASLGGLPPEAISWGDYKPEQILENWFV